MIASLENRLPTTDGTVPGAAGLCQLFSALDEAPDERARGEQGTSYLRSSANSDATAPCLWVSCRQKSSKSCFGSPRHWTRCACSNNSNTYRKHSGGTSSSPKPTILRLSTRSNSRFRSVRRKRFQLLAFQKPRRRCSNSSARENIKKLGGLMTGAHARTPSRASGSRSHPGCSPIQNSQAWTSSISWNRFPQSAIDRPRSEPYSGVSASYARACWSPSMTSGVKKFVNGQTPPPELRAEIVVGVC